MTKTKEMIAILVTLFDILAIAIIFKFAVMFGLLVIFWQAEKHFMPEIHAKKMVICEAKGKVEHFYGCDYK